jgi:hypothetical protein
MPHDTERKNLSLTNRGERFAAMLTQKMAAAALVDLGRRHHLCETNRAFKLLPPLLLLLL